MVGDLAAASPSFRVATRRALFRRPVDDTVHFFQVQRDGASVPARLDRGDRALAAETRHGLRWLDKVWDERHRLGSQVEAASS